VQSLGQAFPALCRSHVTLDDFLLSLHPSLPDLRGRAAQDEAVQTTSGRFGGDPVEGRPAWCPPPECYSTCSRAFISMTT
jgi:hypothetical protein